MFHPTTASMPQPSGGRGAHFGCVRSWPEIYFFLKSASKAARPGLTFSPGGAAGPGVTMRRPVASRTVSGLKNSQVLAAVLEGKRFGIGWRHSKRAPGSKCTQFLQQCCAARHFGHRASVGTPIRFRHPEPPQESAMSGPFPARFVFLPALVLAAGLALPAPARAAVDPGDDARKKNADDAAKDEGKADDKKDEKKEDKDQPKQPPYDKVVKGAKTIQGLFNVYLKEDEAKFFLEIVPDQLDVPFLLNPTLVSGIGQGFIYPNDMLPEYRSEEHTSELQS